MAVIDDARAADLAEKIWWDFQLYYHVGLHREYREFSEENHDADYVLIFDDKYDQYLEDLVDWCFAKNIDAKAIWRYGSRLSGSMNSAQIYPPPVREDCPAWRRAIRDAIRRMATYEASKDFVDCELAMRQIAIVLNTEPPKTMKLNDKIKQTWRSDPGQYIQQPPRYWADRFGVTRQAVEKTDIWQEIKAQQIECKHESEEYLKPKHYQDVD